MRSKDKYPIGPEILGQTFINKDQYSELYKESIEDPEGFWSRQAREFLHWDKEWDKVMDCDFNEPKISWFLAMSTRTTNPNRAANRWGR